MNEGGRPNPAGRVIISAAWVIGLALVAKALGLFKDVIVASRFGTSWQMDAFLVAFTIPTIIISWLESPVRAGFIPLFVERLEKKGDKGAWHDVGVFLADFLVLVAAIIVVGIAAAPWIVRGVAPGFDAAERALAVSLTRIMFVAILFTAVGGIFANIFHCYRNFAIPGLGNPASNLVLIIAAVTLTVPFGIRGLAYGVVFGAAAQALIQTTVAIRHRADLKLRLDFRDPMFLGVLRLAAPLLIGMAGAKLDDIVDRMFASTLSEGSISALAYAIRLIDIPREILIFGFSTVLLPYFSALAAKDDLTEMADKFMTSLRVAFFILFPVSIAMAVLGGPLVRLVFQRGQFDEHSVRFTVSALLLYTPTVWALGLTSIMLTAFVALRDTKTPVIAGFIRLGVKVALVALLVRVFQHAGVALSTSIAHVFKLILFLFLLPKSLREGRYRRLFWSFAGTVAASGLMGLALFYTAEHFVGIAEPPSLFRQVLAIGGLSFLGLVVFVTASAFLVRDELKEVVRALRGSLDHVIAKIWPGAPTPE
jgi:putative peptidoglycan lipid II flippase